MNSVFLAEFFLNKIFCTHPVKWPVIGVMTQ
ncbi:hypothetical protein FIC_02391 [Flavobacteriaceae bacterium 3519-10]|nr:hypothetical protein FIC_02391 [Flavobacteriaceae bacterium 3519-10]